MNKLLLTLLLLSSLTQANQASTDHISSPNNQEGFESLEELAKAVNLTSPCCPPYYTFPRSQPLPVSLVRLDTDSAVFDAQNRFLAPPSIKPFTGNLIIINSHEEWKMADKNYVDGILHGSEKLYYQSGKLKSVGYFKKGLIDSTTTLYYEDGTVQAQVSFNTGIREGKAASYYPNGTIQSEQFYVDDKLDGSSREWFESGILMISRDYSNGLLHGEVKTYYESGKVFEVTTFNYGTPKSKFIYHEDGSLADKQGYLNKKIINSIIS